MADHPPVSSKNKFDLSQDIEIVETLVGKTNLIMDIPQLKEKPTMVSLTKKKSTSTRNNQSLSLQMETLEDRQMLSGVQIFAAGDLGGEEFALQIDGQTVEQFTVSQDLSTFDFQTDQAISADQVSIVFLNDQFDPANGIDSNLIVDAIEIDGIRFETESSSVFSTGTFLSEDGITPGFGRGEVLNANGLFQFCLLYTSPSPRDKRQSRMPSSA